MLYKRYSGETLSVQGVRWRAEIWQESDAEFAAVGELRFESDEFAIVDWPSIAKHDVIEGSTVTLRLESPGDRTYTDLYTETPGTIVLRLYRDNVLWWTGSLDPEFYEEPYNRADHYPVSLIFSDFGALDRIEWDGDGIMSLMAVLRSGLTRSMGAYVSINTNMISTTFVNSEPITLAEIGVRANNFYDEEGKPEKMRRVIEGVLQPLGLHIRQRAGRVFVYDLNGLYNSADQVRAYWTGDSSTLGVDSVYNKVVVTWSPYAVHGELNEAESWPDEVPTPNNLTMYVNPDAQPDTRGAARRFCYLAQGMESVAGSIEDNDALGWTLWLTDSDCPNATLGTGAQPFRMVKGYSGEDNEGVALDYCVVDYTKEPGTAGRFTYTAKDNYRDWEYPTNPTGIQMRPAATSEIKLGPVTNSLSLALKVSMDLLVTPAPDPHNENTVNGKDRMKTWEDDPVMIYVPVEISFIPDDGSAPLYWDNDFPSVPQVSLMQTRGQWSTSYAQSVLAWYSASDRDKNPFTGGFVTNRPAIRSQHKDKLASSLLNTDGQIIPYPCDKPGRLRIVVYINHWDMRVPGDIGDKDAPVRGYQPLSLTVFRSSLWRLFTLPQVSLIKNTTFDQDIDTEDVEYEGELNPNAAEELPIDTICGTCRDGVPTGRGIYIDLTTDKQITMLSRAGRTSQVEELLIGTLFSQYAARSTKLSGEIRIASSPMPIYTEDNQPLRRFFVAAERQDVIKDVAEVTLVELRPDEYEKI